ncbi:MAG: acetyl-CoA carboxylase biotin carboxyl carrier protein subunit [Saprospiraceae bacterium]|nr:acetyl-CoA carboxylase biotin carboxyl carrier protein subunit [Saprospiraceae bacterium]
MDFIALSNERFHVLQYHQSYEAHIFTTQPKQFEVLINGNSYLVNVLDEQDMLVQRMGLSSSNNQQVKEVKAPMPGLVQSILVQTGQTVSKGDGLLILEAMKMENVLKSPTDGQIKAILVTNASPVEKGQLLVVFE